MPPPEALYDAKTIRPKAIAELIRFQCLGVAMPAEACCEVNVQKKPRVCKIVCPQFWGPKVPCAIFMGAWHFLVLSAGKPHTHKFLLLGGEVSWRGGGWKCRSYFYGRGDFSDLGWNLIEIGIADVKIWCNFGARLSTCQHRITFFRANFWEIFGNFVSNFALFFRKLRSAEVRCNNF